MNEDSSGGLASASKRQRLRELSRALLGLHKALLDTERDLYEQRYGSVSKGELLQLVISHEQFAWLRSLSELIVEIDEALAARDGIADELADRLLAQVRALVKPSEEESVFGRKYYAALQREPDAVLAHKDVTRLVADA